MEAETKRSFPCWHLAPVLILLGGFFLGTSMNWLFSTSYYRIAKEAKAATWQSAEPTDRTAQLTELMIDNVIRDEERNDKYIGLVLLCLGTALAAFGYRMLGKHEARTPTSSFAANPSAPSSGPQ